MEKVAFNLLLYKFLTVAETFAFFAFIDLLQAQLSISLSQRKEWLLYALALCWAVYRLLREKVKYDTDKLTYREKLANVEILEEQARKAKIENDLLERSS